MSSIDLLKRQHKEVGAIIQKLEEQIAAQDVTDKCFEISMNIAQLAGKLSMHLNSEDKYLYPSLMQHTNPEIKQVSLKFSSEMGNLLHAFTDYKNKYMVSQNIKKNPMQFVNDSRNTINAIKKRVSSEEKELYPLL